MNNSKDYIPGMCNINKDEINKRRMIGYAGLGVLIFLALTLIVLDFNQGFRVLLFLPAFIMATGFLQAQNKFCVGYAGAGMQHTDKDAVQIEDQAALAADKAKAKKLNTQAFVAALVITIVLTILPL